MRTIVAHPASAALETLRICATFRVPKSVRQGPGQAKEGRPRRCTIGSGSAAKALEMRFAKARHRMTDRRYHGTERVVHFLYDV
jgi:hypothetical protein